MRRDRRSAMASSVTPCDRSTSSVSAPNAGALPSERRLAAELHRRGDEHDLALTVVLDALHVAVGAGLGVVLHLAGGKDDVPLAVLRGEQLLPLGQVPLEEQLVEQLDERFGVGGPGRRSR